MIHRTLTISLALVAIWAVPAAAQMPTVEPDGSSQPAAPPPQPRAAARKPVIIQTKPDGTVMVPDDQGQGPQRYFFGEGEDTVEKTTQNWDVKVHGPVPEHHVVRRGDTLWDISWLYFNDPWQWPKVWSYNPSITNPNWIYPGDLVRLYPQGQAPVVIAPPPEDANEPIDVSSPIRHPAYSAALRQLAYLDKDKLKFAGTIVGSVDAKMMLSTGDEVYVEYPKGRPPKVGESYAIYTEQQQVRHPDSGKVIGSYVRILGELRVQSVKKDKRARAVIEDANDVIERGARVGPIQRSYHGEQITPTAAKKNAAGTIVARLRHDQIIGQGEIVFIDLGKQQGVARGNILYVVRRGDAMEEHAGRANVGQNDTHYPARSIGRIMLVDVGKNASAGLVVDSLREFEAGDRVLLRKAE